MQSEDEHIEKKSAKLDSHITSTHNYIYMLLSFVVPVLIMFFAYISVKVFPFGDKSILIMDMNSQYVDFFSAFRDSVFNQKSILYSWSKVLGGNFLGLFAYYLSSPFSIIVILAPAKYLLESLLALTLVKLGAAGLTFYLYIGYVFKRKNVYTFIFSTFYALIAYGITFSMNVMWLDGIIFLPLIVIGIEKIVKENRVTFFCIFLTLMFTANFYIAYMILILGFFYFLYRLIAESSIIIAKQLFKKVWIFAGASIISICCSAWILIPTYFALKAGKITKLDWARFFPKPAFNIFILFFKSLIGSYDTVYPAALPNIYCGILTLFLLGLFFLNNKITRKEKFLSFALITFVVICFNINSVDLVLHGFQSPICFPYRYSFFLSFIILTLAYKCFINMDGIGTKSITKVFLVILSFVILLQQFGYKYMSNATIYLSLMFIIIYFILLYLYKVNRLSHKLIAALTVFIVLAELLLNTFILVNRLNKELTYNTRDSYLQFKDQNSQLINSIAQKDPGFYRIEKTFYRSTNDAMSLGYSGVSHFSSTYENSTNTFLKNLGVLGLQYWITYEGSTMVTDSISGIKYILSKTPYNSYYATTDENNGVVAYKNPYVLPIGFMTNNGLLNVDSSNLNAFEFQNKILGAMLDRYDNPLQPIPIKNVRYKNLEKSTQAGYIQYSKIDSNSNAYIDFTLAPRSGSQSYACFPSNYEYSVEILLNGDHLADYTTLGGSILDLGSYQTSSEIVVRIAFRPQQNDLRINDTLFYGLDVQNLNVITTELNAHPFKIFDKTDTLVRGTITVDNNKTLLYTSVPYDAGWKAKIDGNSVETKKVLNALVALDVPNGEHEVELKYFPQGLLVGLTISILSIGFSGIGALYFAYIRSKTDD